MAVSVQSAAQYFRAFHALSLPKTAAALHADRMQFIHNLKVDFISLGAAGIIADDKGPLTQALSRDSNNILNFAVKSVLSGSVKKLFTLEVVEGRNVLMGLEEGPANRILGCACTAGEMLRSDKFILLRPKDDIEAHHVMQSLKPLFDERDSLRKDLYQKLMRLCAFKNVETFRNFPLDPLNVEAIRAELERINPQDAHADESVQQAFSVLVAEAKESLDNYIALGIINFDNLGIAGSPAMTQRVNLETARGYWLNPRGGNEDVGTALFDLTGRKIVGYHGGAASRPVFSGISPKEIAQ